MSMTFQHNRDRAQRVSDLATHIAFMQDDAADKNNGMNVLEEAEQKAFEEVAKRAGAASVEEYVDKLMSTMPDDVKKEYEDAKQAYLDVDSSMRKTYISEVGIAAFGYAFSKVWANLGPERITGIMRRVNYFSVLRVVNQAMAALARGASTLANVLSKLAGTLASKLFTWMPSAVSTRLANAWRWVSRGAGASMVLSSLLLIGIIAVDAILGKKQRDELRKIIISAASSRFAAKRIDMEFEILIGIKGAMTGIAASINLLSKFYEAGFITQEVYEQEVDVVYQTVADPLSESIEAITDTDVKTACDGMDDEEAWTEDDPDIAAMNKWIEENPPDDGGNVAASSLAMKTDLDKAGVNNPSLKILATEKPALPRNHQIVALTQMAAINYR